MQECRFELTLVTGTTFTPNGAISEKFCLSFGLPPGSCLGPLTLSSTLPSCSILLSHVYLKFTVLLMTLSYIYHLNLVMPKQKTKPLQLWKRMLNARVNVQYKYRTRVGTY